MVRLQITLDQTEADAVMSWATTELRDPREQIRFVLRQELERRGLLQSICDEDLEQREPMPKGGICATTA